MYCYFQKPNTSTSVWDDFGIVIKPLKLKKALTADVEGAWQVNLQFTADTPALLPGQICRFKFAASGDYYIYVVIVDGGKASLRGAQSKYHHTYAVQELLCATREIHIQTAFFTGASYTTASAFFTRLWALCDSPYTLELSTDGDYATLVANYLQNDYQVTSNALLDNLVKIGANLGVRFKAVYTIATNTLSLIAYSRKGGATITSITGTLISDNTQYKGSNYAAKVAATVNNVGTGQYKWWPGYSFTQGALAEPSDQYATETTIDDIVLVCPHNIRDAKTLRVVGFKSVLATNSVTPDGDAGGYDYKYFYPNGVEIEPDAPDPTTHYVVYDDSPSVQTQINSGTKVDEFDIVEYAEWILLDETGTGSQEDTLYYKRGENKIYNIKVCQGFGTAGWVYELKKYSGGVYQSSVFQYQYMKYQLNYYSVEANFYIDGEIIVDNNVGTKRTAFYSQEENQVDGKALVSNMQEYADSMNNSEYEASYSFAAYTDIPLLGAVYGGKVLYEIEMEFNYATIAAILRFSDDIVPKSEYLSADDGIQLPAIPLDKAFDRVTNYRTNIWLCPSLASAQAYKAKLTNDTYYGASTVAAYLFGAFENPAARAPAPLEDIHIRTGDDSGTYVYTWVSSAVAALNNALVVNFKTIDNRIIGRTVDDGLGTDIDELRFYPINFINDTGICIDAWFKIKSAAARDDANFPAIDETTFTSSGSTSISIHDTAYYHDKAERAIVTYEINGHMTPPKTGKVLQGFWEESRFLKDSLFVADTYTRYVLIDVHLCEITAATATIANVESGVYTVIFTISTPGGFDHYGTVFCTFVRVAGAVQETMAQGYAHIANDGSNDYVKLWVAFTK